jgi:hypothetical protein
MSRLSISIRVAVAIGVAALAARVTLDAESPQLALASPPTAAAVVSLKISNEIAPPGGIAQMKVFVTEPKPISTAFADVGLGGFGDVVGISLGTPDALGVAVVDGSRLSISILSPSTTFGMTPDYPVLTIAGHVSANAPLGTTFPVDMPAAALQFQDPSGALYATAVNPGSLFVAPYVGIEAVTPGSGTAQPGDVVTLAGRGFTPGTQVRVKEATLSTAAYVDPGHIDVTFATPTYLQGAAVEVVNPDKTHARYFSYQRTARQAPSLNATLQSAVPVFADVDVTTATVGVQGNVTGLALQNRQPNRVFAACALVDATGVPISVRVVAVEPRRFLLLELSELFGVAYSPSQTVRVLSLAPIQVMGVAVDTAGAATPIPAQ